VRFFVDDALNALQVFLVVVFLVQCGVQPAVRGPVVVECFPHA
jgi:hypothetical protein